MKRDALLKVSINNLGLHK